ncbi:MAG: restriction endonuclease subunit S [Treponema sp.]|jgi:type I restriction enzyme S subunit|nr:restriction endonuclease subunit S [Treponema sp.]
MNKFKINAICDINKNALSATDSFKNIFYLETSGITNNKITEIQELFIANIPSRAQRKVKDKTIIYSTVRPSLKHFGILNNPPLNFIVSTGFVTLDIKIECFKKINPVFLYYKLTQNDVTTYLHCVAENSVSSYPSISPSDIGNLIFEFPSYEIQCGLVKILTSLDNKIELNNKINKELEATAKELYNYWFVQFDFPNKNGKPYKSSGGKMIWNEKLNREIPNKWKVLSINDMASNCRGVTYNNLDILPTSENGILVLRGNNIKQNNLVFDDNTVYIYKHLVSNEQCIKKHDIILTMSSGSKEHIGKCVMFQNESPHTFGTFLSKFTPHSDKPYFVFLSMLTEYFKQKIHFICNGTGINNLTNQTFDELFFAVPDPAILSIFEMQAKVLFEKIGINNLQNEKLSQLRDFLLPLLMNGQVTVSDEKIETSKPARLQKTTNREQRFEQWLNNQKIAARGETDLQTFRELFDAMDDDDK